MHWFTLDWATAIDRHRPYGIFAKRLSTKVDHYRTIYEYIKYLDQLGALALVAENDHPLIQHHVLELWEEVSRMHTHYQFPFSVPPSPEVVYRLFYSPNPMAVDRICGIVAQYKEEFTQLKKSVGTNYPMQLTFNRGSEKVKYINSYIWDFCSALWRCRILTLEGGEVAPKETMGLDPSVIQYLRSQNSPDDISRTLSIAQSVTFGTLGYSFLRNVKHVDEDGGALHPRLIRDDLISFVDYLKEKGCSGLYRFLYTFIGLLAKLSGQNPT